MADYGAAARRVVEIARAVSQNARLLILDEPTAALPATERASLLTLIREFASSGGSVLYVSHHLDEILDISDTVTALRNGRHGGTRPRAEVTREVAITMILGTNLEASVGVVDPRPVRSSLTLSAWPPNAGGLRTTSRSAVVKSSDCSGGSMPDTSGSHGRWPVSPGRRRRDVPAWQGLQASLSPRSPATRRRLPARRAQNGGHLPHASVTENVVAGGAIGVVGGGFVRRNERHAVADRWRIQLDIRVPSVRKPIRTLSGGNQQKCLLARLLTLNPALLVLEHPTFGVDLGARVEIYSTIYRATRDGLAVLVVSDDLDELQVLADRVVVFRNGAIQGCAERRRYIEWPNT